MPRFLSYSLVLALLLSVLSNLAVWTQLRQLEDVLALRVPSPTASQRPEDRADVAIKEPLSLAGAQIRGRQDSKVAILEFSDFQCPFCAKFTEGTLPELERAYVDRGDVLFAFRHLPLERVHQFALSGAVAAECAGKQGKFWPMHDFLFRSSRSLDQSTVASGARSIGLASPAFDECISNGQEGRITQDLAEAKRLGVSGTPTFFIGRLLPGNRLQVDKRLNGAQAFTAFKVAIEASQRLIGAPSQS